MRAETGALPHQAAERDRVLRRVSRTDDGRAVADGVEAAAAAAFCPAGAGCDARALSRCVSRLRGRHAGRRQLCAGLRPLYRRETVQDHAGSGGSGGDLRRAGAGRGRLRGGSEDLYAGTKAHLRPSRHHAGGRRSAERHWAHGEVVRGRAHRRRAGYGLHGEGHCVGHAAGRHR